MYRLEFDISGFFKHVFSSGSCLTSLHSVAWQQPTIQAETQEQAALQPLLWSSQSPYFNIIETNWEYMKRNRKQAAELHRFTVFQRGLELFSQQQLKKQIWRKLWGGNDPIVFFQQENTANPDVLENVLMYSTLRARTTVGMLAVLLVCFLFTHSCSKRGQIIKFSSHG